MENTIIDPKFNFKLTTKDSFISQSESRQYNTNMLKEIPTLKDTIVPTVGNHFFFPKQFPITEDEINEYIQKYKFEIDDTLYINSKVIVDDSPVYFHQHLSAIIEQGKTYNPYEAINFNLEGIKLIFDNKIPLCFKQSIALLALYKKEPEILSIAFEQEELVQITYELCQKLLTN